MSKKQAILKRRALDEDPEISTVLEFNFSNTTHNVFVTFDITSNNDGELIIKSNSGNSIMSISNTEVYFDRTVNVKTILINNANLEEMVTSSFNTANASGGTAVAAAFNKANSANIVAASAYDAANAAGGTTASEAFNKANSANIVAESSFASGNTTYTYAANTVMLVANSAYGGANSTYTYAANTVMSVANAAFSMANAANLMPVGNTMANNYYTVRATRRQLNFVPGTNITINVDDNSTLNTVNITITSTASGGDTGPAFDKANAANILASDAYGFANIANVRAVAAFTAANNASGGSPGGPNLSIQYKSDSSFAGSNNLYYDISSNTLVISENVSYINTKAVIPPISSNLGFSIDSSNDCIMILDNSGSNTINSICVGDLFLQVFTRNLRGGFNFFTDFINELSTTATDNGLSETNSGTSAATSIQAADTANSVLGMVRSTTGTTATGRAAVASGISIFRFGNGETYFETRLRINTISNGTERYQLIVGFLDTLTAANQVDAAAFLYDDGGVSTGSTASNNWQTLTASNSNRTFNTGLVNTATTTGWVRLGILVNAAGNSVNFYINDSLVATHTANIPTTGRDLGFGWLLIKSAGTTARVVDFDYLSVTSKFTNRR